MTRATRTSLIVIAAIILLVIAAQMLGGRLGAGSVLVMEISGGIEEQRPPGIAGQLAGGGATVLHQFLDAMDTAKSDSRIAGLAVKVSSPEIGWGKMQEIRSHLLEFRRSGKPSICYVNEDIVDNGEYYLAAACDQVWMIPTAGLGLRGLMAQATFLRGTLDKLKIYPDYYHIAEYKNAKNILTEKKFTPAHREATESVLRSIYAQYVTETAQARKLDRAKFEALVHKGPYLAGEALANKLVDRLAYWDDVQEFFKEKNKDKEWQPVELRRYLKEVKNVGMEKIAVVHATGTIIVGKSDYDPVLGFVMGSDSVAADLRRAREDKSIKAIVLRVDSGGGSAAGSEIIRREMQLAKKEKPVVVSMSDVAGSGGYWIAMSANKIVADPATITASIGVVAGKFNVAGFYDLLGLSTDHVATSDNATLFWSQQNFTPAQREALQKWMQDIYANFLKGVAEGRKLKVEDVDKIGKGRIWTGAQAKELKLVDEVGGLERAVTLARELAKIPADKKVQLVWFPEEKPLWMQILEKGDTPILSGGLAAELRRLARVTQPVQVRVPFDLRIR